MECSGVPGYVVEAEDSVMRKTVTVLALLELML